jgi:hypothetical protein
MKASLASMLRWLVLPWGKTTGQRIVLDGDNGKISVYDASNSLSAEVTSAPGGFRTEGDTVSHWRAYSLLSEGKVEFGTVDGVEQSPAIIEHYLDDMVGIVPPVPNASIMEITNGAPDATAGQIRIELLTRTTGLGVQVVPTVTFYATGGADHGARVDIVTNAGVVRSANVQCGRVNITPVANTPTSVTVTYPQIRSRTAASLSCQVTANTNVPGSVVQEVSYNSLTVTSVNLWIYRTTATTTELSWLVMAR